MKFKFSKNLEYQLSAISSVVNIFDTGKNSITSHDFTLHGSTQIIPNQLEIDKVKILENLQAIQKNNRITPISSNISDLSTMDFSIEMETGTGKTYVYLRTIHELHKKYSLNKFIILVPSVAIREGVAKTIDQTRTHFKELYNFGFGSFVYDSDKLSQVREFVQSNDLVIMIMTVQSFKGKDNLVMRQTPDRFHGDRPLDLVASTRPVVIMDEPQNMDSALAKDAIQDLKPLFKLRYSATHKEQFNLVYRLTPVDAYRQGLVKKIAVWGVESQDAGAFTFQVLDIKTKAGEFPSATVLVEVKLADDTFTTKEITLRPGDDLLQKTKNSKYTDLEIRDINATHNRVVLSDGTYHTISDPSGNKVAIFRTQIRETIKAHMDKQSELGDEIKVLSLFFIDRVANYVESTGAIRQIFTEEFNRLKQNYPQFQGYAVDEVHKGYFASKKTKDVIEYLDTSGKTNADKDAYNLIMKEKERLLSFSEPVSFIFSHSALKEGWDNPNVFQICTLREVRSQIEKRQEIGRGLRLPVNKNLERVYDDRINTLTVIANESYQQYANSLQKEFIEAGYKQGITPQNARGQKVTITPNQKYLIDNDFLTLWDKIKNKTKYQIEVSSDKLIALSIAEINKLSNTHPHVTVSKGQIYFDSQNNVKAVHENLSVGEKINNVISIPNIISRLAKETGITKKTAFSILSQVTNLEILNINPEEYIRSMILIINTTLNDLLLNEGLKYIPTGEYWELSLFQPFQSLLESAVPSQKSPYSHIVFDSKNERIFAEALEYSPNCIVYTKLPRSFHIDTPLGQYNPDWAIVWKENGKEKLYLVRETKFEYQDFDNELSQVEINKIKCGKKHFALIGFLDFSVSESPTLEDLVTGAPFKYSL